MAKRLCAPSSIQGLCITRGLCNTMWNLHGCVGWLSYVYVLVFSFMYECLGWGPAFLIRDRNTHEILWEISFFFSLQHLEDSYLVQNYDIWFTNAEILERRGSVGHSTCLMMNKRMKSLSESVDPAKQCVESAVIPSYMKCCSFINNQYLRICLCYIEP